MSGQRSRKIHQRSSSTGSGLLFGIGAAAGPHHVIHPQHHLLASQQLSSPSPDPLTSDDEESEDLDIKGTYSYNSIKRICSIKRPGLEIFKNILLNVPYHRLIAFVKQLNVLFY